MQFPNKKPLIIAHRGASAYAPENTIEAFALAAEMGADGIELDVHMTADDEVIVLHDSKVDRTSNGQGRVSSYRLEELRWMDFGCRFYKEQRKGNRIPTLDEVFELVEPLGMIVNVEIKSGDPKLPAACAEIAKRHGMENRVLYSSGNHFQLRRMKELEPGARIAPLCNFNLLDPWSYCPNIGAQAIHPQIEEVKAVEGYVEKCHAQNVLVNTWTVNEEDDIRFCLRAGVDGIITNVPDVVRRLRDEENKTI